MTINAQPSGGTASGGPSNSRSSGRHHHGPRPLPGRATARCVGRLQALYRQDDPVAVATLARLRRGIGQRAHESPGTWGIDGLEELARLREEQGAESLLERGEAPPRFFSADEGGRVERRETAEEEAVHLAVTLWALHQQSVRDANMHEFEWSLGRAVRRLAWGKSGTTDPVTTTDQEGRKAGPQSDDELSESLRKRFVRVGTANSFDSLAVRLREMVVLLHNARIPLDYGRLADQLCTWQDENRRGEVRREWGREFHLSFSEGARSGSGIRVPGAPPSSADAHDESGADMHDPGD
ncbi:type I-E CRISPR-associated protein Cse2/CasB [Streptomyces sp. NPDC002537]